jgi:hypothetical protein
VERQRTWRGVVVAAAAAAAVALLAAGCGGSAGAEADGVATAGGSKGTGSADATAAGKEQTDPQQAGLDFARCMREHGVDMPDPQISADGGETTIRVGPPPGSVDGDAAAGGTAGPPPGFEEADKACRHFLDDLVQDKAGPMGPEAQDRMLKFTQCMRDHGVDMPDPDFSGGGGGFRAKIGPGGVDPSSETFKEAQKACGALFGPDGPGLSAKAGGGATSASVEGPGGKP